MEKLGYILLGSVMLLWLVGMIVGMIAIMPYGLVGLVAMAGAGLLLTKVLRERIANREDEHYDKDIHQ